MFSHSMKLSADKPPSGGRMLTCQRILRAVGRTLIEEIDGENKGWADACLLTVSSNHSSRLGIQLQSRKIRVAGAQESFAAILFESPIQD